MRLIDAEALKDVFNGYHTGTGSQPKFTLGACLQLIDNASTVELTEEQAIDKLHETGWLIRHDKEMTERPHGECVTLTEEAYSDLCLRASRERPHGKWIEKIYTEKLGHGYLTHHEIVCSVCGGSGENDENIPQCWKFCPNCGADMRGEE